jgi:hypothetical protein
MAGGFRPSETRAAYGGFPRIHPTNSRCLEKNPVAVCSPLSVMKSFKKSVSLFFFDTLLGMAWIYEVFLWGFILKHKHG